MSGEIDISKLLTDPETITEEEEAAIGATLARVFKLRRDPEHNDRWQTTGGNKTDLGVYRVAAGIIKDHKRYAED